MQGRENDQKQLFGTTPVESLIPQDHALRKIRTICDEAMAPLAGACETQYSDVGQPRIPPQVRYREGHISLQLPKTPHYYLSQIPPKRIFPL